MHGVAAAQSMEKSRPLLGALLACAFVGTWLALMPFPMMILAMLVDQIAPAHKAGALAQILGVGAFAGLVAQPIFGALSDRTTSRWGMRKPWILGGMLSGVASMALLLTAQSLPQLLLGWTLMQLTFNSTLSALNAIIPDQVPPAKLGFYSGLIGFTPPIGIILGAFLVKKLAPDLVTVGVAQAVIFAVTTLAFVVLANDRRIDVRERQPFVAKDLLRSFWSSPRKHPDFAWAWLSRALVYCGVMSLTMYQLFFLTERLGVSQRDLPRIMFLCLLVSTVGMVITGLLFGKISDRLQRRKIFVVAASLALAVSLAAISMSTSLSGYLIAIAAFGLAQGCYLSVDLALVTEVLPDRNTAAKDMGVFHLANVIPQVLLPVWAPFVIGLQGGNNYGAFFLSSAIICLIGAAAILPVRSVR